MMLSRLLRSEDARQTLDWEPRVGVTEGINRLCDWIDAQQEAAPPAPTGTAAEV